MFGTKIAEAYAALEAMLEEEERSRLQTDAMKIDLPYKMAKTGMTVPWKMVWDKTPSRLAEIEWSRTRPR